MAIYEQLKRALGDNAVFMDVDDIPHGEDFVVHLDKVLTKANTVLVMIGEQWLNAANANGRRLDDPNDFVRMEIAKALQRNIRVIPVLLKNAQMPTAAALPETLQTLSRKNGIRIYDDQFEASIQRLLDAIATQ
ncbi:toll/interleukin-1 receptor domain-containing protein [Thiothrix subterranea]|uniref:toll/interleukin-1 receptor domain-containing protein n=1 Tax=Thiothrix subterranea TaxID=2735563 RepID=UPI001D186FC6|nr:toll/interleukin-1 receptor domain-containing protein [Thiothrix subterranea]